MTRDLVASILSPSPDRIKRIELRNLQQWSELEPPLPKFETSRELLDYWPKNGFEHKQIDDTSLMNGALDPILGLTTHLTSLCITTVGDSDRRISPDDWQTQCYASWARYEASCAISRLSKA